jgi:hypothetical protein
VISSIKHHITKEAFRIVFWAKHDNCHVKSEDKEEFLTTKATTAKRKKITAEIAEGAEKRGL